MRTPRRLLTRGGKVVRERLLAYQLTEPYGGRRMPVRLGACLLAEFVGTFALCFVGILAIHAPGGLVGVALAHGLILSIMVTATMPTSGGHLNPAVTFGFLITGKIKPPAGIAYIVIQLLAGTIAAMAVYAMFGGGTVGQKVVFDGTPNFLVDPNVAS